jgi:hypothetical protein
MCLRLRSTKTTRSLTTRDPMKRLETQQSLRRRKQLSPRRRHMHQVALTRITTANPVVTASTTQCLRRWMGSRQWWQYQTSRYRTWDCRTSNGSETTRRAWSTATARFNGPGTTEKTTTISHRKRNNPFTCRSHPVGWPLHRSITHPCITGSNVSVLIIYGW